jgi:hypothetical protein
MKTICPSEKLVTTYKTTWQNIPEHIITSIAGNLHIQNFESANYDEHAPNYI